MCSIGGSICYSSEYNKSLIADLIRLIRHQMLKGRERGKDAIGFNAFDNCGQPVEMYRSLEGYVPHINNQYVHGLTVRGVETMLYHNRAQPVTEVSSVAQPVEYLNWHVVHNGLIANDREIIEKYKLALDPDAPDYIDSMVLPHMLRHLEVCSYATKPIHALRDFLTNELKGSFAFAAYNTHDPGALILACNYKPIYIYSDKPDYMCFASQPDHITTSGFSSPTKMTPYTMQVFSKNWSPRYENNSHISHEVHSLRENPNRKCLVVFSGGMDSTVVAAYAKHKEYDVTLLHYNYNCKAHANEERAVIRVAADLGCAYRFMPLDLFTRLGKSSLIDRDLDVTLTSAGAAEYATEWVPARNLVMLSIAAAIAEAEGFHTIMFGGNLEESGSHPDNEIEMVNHFNNVLHNAVNTDSQLRLVAPLGNMMKREIVELGIQLNAPLKHSWTCYTDHNHPCGVCGACYNRMKGFEAAGVNDPALSLIDDIPF